MIGDGHKYNDRISFACDVGYKLEGDAEAVCLKTGNWSVNTPQCQRKFFYYLSLCYYCY